MLPRGATGASQVAAILLAALALRLLFFVGFGLGDDLGYLAYVDLILHGSYPPLDPLNQYAYRPLLLLMYAGGVALFGYTDFGVVAPVLLASLATTALVYVFVRRFIDPAAAWWCALIFAFEPFNVVNSTTMTNDVILSGLIFAAVTLLLGSERAVRTRRGLGGMIGAAVLMLAAFLVKITVFPALCALGLYSLLAARRRSWAVLQRHAVFYASFAVGIGIVCLVYYALTGDPLWQFKSERHYYEVYKPEWYVAGAIDYASLMSYYPRSLFGLSGYRAFAYLEHGLLFWLFLPAAAVVVIRRGNPVLKFLVGFAAVVFAFFQFYPQHVSPRYLPLVRQERYLEMLLPAAAIVVGTMLKRLHGRRPVLVAAVMSILLADFVLESGRRSHQYNDSQHDVRELARYAAGTIGPTGKPLFVDVPARNALAFHLRDAGVRLEELKRERALDVRDAYVAVGGARTFWWSPDLTFEVPPPQVPPDWILTYQIDGPPRPWRRSPLRVYYAP